MESRGITTGSVVNAAKEKLGPEEALGLVNQRKKLVAAKGKKLVELELAGDGSQDEELQKLIIGPSGNLRAPTWIYGDTVVVGFNEDAYADVLG